MHNLIRFFRRYYFIFLFLALEGVSIYLVSQNTYYQGSYFLRMANQISGQANTYTSNIFQYFNLASANKALVEENAMLRARDGRAHV